MQYARTFALCKSIRAALVQTLKPRHVRAPVRCISEGTGEVQRTWGIWYPTYNATVKITETVRGEPQAIDDIIKNLGVGVWGRAAPAPKPPLLPFFIEMMQRLQETLDEIKKKRRGGWQNSHEIGKIVQDWASEKASLIKSVYLFGSRVREDFTPESDLDVAIVLRMSGQEDEKAL